MNVTRMIFNRSDMHKYCTDYGLHWMYYIRCMSIVQLLCVMM